MRELSKEFSRACWSTALIEIKFGESGLKLLPELRKIGNANRLREIKDAIRVVLDVKEVEKMLYH